MSDPTTLIEAVRYFADLDVCNEYMTRIKWGGNAIVCPACGAKGERIGEIATRRMLRCKDCRKQFSHKVGTIFEDSPLPLGHWFAAIWCIAHGDDVSSPVLAGALGVTQRTAWFLLHRIRKAMELIPRMSDKPEGWRAFVSLAKQLVQIPKEKLDAKVAKDKAKRIKKRKDQ